MKAIKASIWYDTMIETFKTAVICSMIDIQEKNGGDFPRNLFKEHEKEIDDWFNSINFKLYHKPSFENVISKMADEYFDHQSDKINLWVDICKKTANDPQLPWQMIIERADNVLEQYEKRFNNEKTENDEQ